MPQDVPFGPALARPIVGWQPITFQERGVAVPFTTPLLAGARLRRGERGYELVLAEVCGPGSVGIVPWDRIGEVCRLTLFDRRLCARLAGLAELSPRAVRAAACAEAEAGLAGHEAQQAACAAAAVERAALSQAAAEVRRALGRAEAEQLPAGVAALPELVASLRTRWPTLGARLDWLAQRLGERLRLGPGVTGEEAALVLAATEFFAARAGKALAVAQALIADLPLLLRRLARAPGATEQELAAPEWLLDGWAWLCALAATEEEAIARAMAGGQFAALLPPLPRELGETGLPAYRPTTSSRLLDALRRPDPRKGATNQDLIARNERLLAAALALPGAAQGAER